MVPEPFVHYTFLPLQLSLTLSWTFLSRFLPSYFFPPHFSFAHRHLRTLFVADHSTRQSVKLKSRDTLETRRLVVFAAAIARYRPRQRRVARLCGAFPPIFLTPTYTGFSYLLEIPLGFSWYISGHLIPKRNSRNLYLLQVKIHMVYAANTDL